ncbi:major capsid protein [Oceanicaulis alexandrii]|uniref:major capsid protein n=1 Tax=Oceanicaulis alexandrii TaxID=153233 RepID=UPI0035CEC66A
MFNFPFTARALTQEVRKYPKRYGVVSGLNVMPLEPISSTFVQITEENGTLRVLPAQERGSPGSRPDRKRQSLKIFQVPHFPVEDQILAKDLQDRMVVMNGQEVPANLTDETAKRLAEIGRRHSITAEYLRMQALKGILKDGSGDVLTNLFDDFGVTQKVVDFKLGTDGTSIREKDEEVRAHVEDNLLGDSFESVEALVSPEFFDKLVKHPEVEKFYTSSPDVTQLRLLERYKFANITGRIFNPFGGVTYIEHRGSAPVGDANERFVAAGEGHAYPVGTTNLFSTFAAPADTLSEVNSLPTIMDMDLGDGGERFALPIFISPEPMKHGKGMELFSEMNVLPFCKQPGAALIKLHTSN